MIRYVNRGLQIVVDLSMLSLAYWLAFFFRFEFHPEFEFIKLLFFTWPYVILFEYLTLALFGVPRFAWRYVGIKEMKVILIAMAASSAVLVGLRLGMVHVGGYAKFVTIPLGVLAMNFIMAFLGIAGARVIRRILAERDERLLASRRSMTAYAKTLLIGAGRAGVLVAKEVSQNPHLGLHVAGFVDDDREKQGTVIAGVKVLGPTASLRDIAAQTGATEAIITIAAASGTAIRTIVEQCEKARLPVKIIPGIYEIIGGKVNLSRIREVGIEDLLGRSPVELDEDAIAAYLTGKRVLVTGAGGSIGSEACRQIARFAPEKLVLVEQAENALYEIHKELAPDYPFIVPAIADVTDAERMDELFSSYAPQVVFHAAAHKHVPMMEWNPGEAVKNNVFGTRTVVDTADRHGVSEFVMISTDKAVNPTSIMGATKRVAELYVQGMGAKSKTKFVAVRFCNVLGSAGSVIPLFKEQIAKGGPVTVTHPEMQRYFMTIPEACRLVMQAATMGNSGDIFVLDMGKPVFIKDLARDLIKLSGFSEDEIPIEYTGLRPGEKLFEELSVTGEDMTKTRHPKIFIGRIATVPEAVLEEQFARMRTCAVCRDNAAIRACLKTLVPEME